MYVKIYEKISSGGLEIVSMIRKYHNHKPQTTPWHREEEPLNHHETPGRQIKQSNQLSLGSSAQYRLASSLINNSLIFICKVRNCLALFDSVATFYTPCLKFMLKLRQQSRLAIWCAS